MCKCFTLPKLYKKKSVKSLRAAAYVDNKGSKKEHETMWCNERRIQNARLSSYELTCGNDLLMRNQFVERLWPILFDPVNMQHIKSVSESNQIEIERMQ